MRNLKCLRHAEVMFPEGEPLSASAWDVATDTVLCAFGPSAGNPLITLRRLNHDGRDIQPKDIFQEVASWDAPSPSPEQPCDRIISLHYFADDLATCLLLAGGDIIMVRDEPGSGREKIEILGTVDAGVAAARWSPDEEVLIISTCADTLLFMTRELDNLAEVSMTAADLAVSNHVSVGWGKAETQFKGKRAKALRDPTVPEHVDEGTPSSTDDGKVSISWRGDAAYVAVSAMVPGRRRVIRVYSREGILDSVSEPVDGLEAALSWRPTGNLIAAIQRLPNRVDVVFFERNGLRHGQFPLRLTPEEMTDWASDIALEWNSQSTALAVSFRDRVQLWTMGNYHYYLKQEVRLDEGQKILPMISSRWHPERDYRLVVPSSKLMLLVEYQSMVARGSTLPPNDLGSVAVIDGETVKLTPLRVANVPPPMAHCEVSVDFNIIDIAFSQGRSLVAVLGVDGFEIFSWIAREKRSQRLHRVDTFNGLDMAGSLIVRQICFVGEMSVAILASDRISSRVIIFDFGQDEPIVRRTSSQILVGGSYRLFAGDDSDHNLLVQRDDCVLLEGLWNGDEMTFQEIARLPALKPWVEAIKREGETVVFGLGANGHLHANERLLAKNCTSFLITPAHLIFTTTQHLLKFVHIASVDKMEIPQDSPEEDERCRSIERGARLVTVMPTKFCLILQMPRGNLETIYPRALVLAGIRQSIAMKAYRAAFLACRNQRVDMNILYDHAPQQFHDNVGLFVEQISKIEHLDLFLSALKEEDVSKTMYRETIVKDSEDHVQPDGSPALDIPLMAQVATASKVNRICDALLEILTPRMATNMQNIITAHTCKNPPDLEAGLSLVAQLRQDNAELAEKAIEHMCFLVDINKLYDNALGLYDLDLTLLVAQQSQKDPREYLPFLQRLRDMTVSRRRFSIDDGLGRYERALKNLHELDGFEELKTYTIKHTLFAEALTLYRYRPEALKEITHLYADHLSQTHQYREAGLAYESISAWTPALEAYRAANLWREVLSCSFQIPLTAPQQHTLAISLSSTLYENKSYYDAATIQLDHLHDVESAARSLCKGYHFSDATRILHLHTRSDLLPTIIDVALTDSLSSTTTLLADFKDQLHAQIPRLRLLRTKKTEDPLAFYDGPTSDTAIPDNVSLAGTSTSTTAGGASLFTRYTGGATGTLNTQTSRKTSKNRRREERKRARGKKGSVYEEEYLVNSIGRLIERVDSVRDDVLSLVEGCVRRGMRERAMALQRGMSEVVDLCTGCVEEVFTGGVRPGEDGRRVAGRGDTGDDAGDADDGHQSGAEGVLLASLESRGKREIPIVRTFKTLSLLGQ